ncbi:23S rRNA (uracil(1939)-C(5))-methyltransferase RlmD [Paraferrimonas sp. SM1919]|uniref:23S rRNA (uracil(1939)-C(5))-methyltransferase RlmD n=1 Tax=Paraferrimonas sp. SM1919 TaxID=2662263 RepID=UPI0013D40C1A|nr:23S rRNA (uracil(1939)-C(5))-methyltransferase RlmD [Paraferrimonas sp. SM1919]
MAQFFKSKTSTSKALPKNLTLLVDSLSHFADGVASYQGKQVYIEAALPGEQVVVDIVESKKLHWRAKLKKIDKPSQHRAKPFCTFYGRCGGCQTQHLSVDLQHDYKQQAVLSMVQKATSAKPESIVEPIISDSLHYRRRARLACIYDKQQHRLKLGFRAASSKKIIEVSECLILVEPFSGLLQPLSQLLNQLSVVSHLGHVELIQGQATNVVLLRLMQAPSANDIEILSTFAKSHQLSIGWQDNQQNLNPITKDFSSSASYQLSDQIDVEFTLNNFIQVNDTINQKMVAQAISWLQLNTDDKVLDLFCGVGNFALPMAKLAGSVHGVEGVESMVLQARKNSQRLGLKNLTFSAGDLSDLNTLVDMKGVTKVVVDPARAGAFEIISRLVKYKPSKILYIACNPSSLAQDAKPLVKAGYKIEKMGTLDMFTHTNQIETMALFSL